MRRYQRATSWEKFGGIGQSDPLRVPMPRHFQNYSGSPFPTFVDPTGETLTAGELHSPPFISERHRAEHLHTVPDTEQPATTRPTTTDATSATTKRTTTTTEPHDCTSLNVVIARNTFAESFPPALKVRTDIPDPIEHIRGHVLLRDLPIPIGIHASVDRVPLEHVRQRLED